MMRSEGLSEAQYMVSVSYVRYSWPPYHFGCGIMALYDQERLNYPYTIRNFHPSIGSLGDTVSNYVSSVGRNSQECGSGGEAIGSFSLRL